MLSVVCLVLREDSRYYERWAVMQPATGMFALLNLCSITILFSHFVAPLASLFAGITDH